MRCAAIALMLCLAAGASPCSADDLQATPKFGATDISFELKAAYSDLMLTVTGPNGLHTSAAATNGSPTVDLRRLRAFDDGVYGYNLTASTGEKLPDRSGLDNGRGQPSDTRLRTVSTSGMFEVKGGAIVTPDSALREQTNKRN